RRRTAQEAPRSTASTSASGQTAGSRPLAAAYSAAATAKIKKSRLPTSQISPGNHLSTPPYDFVLIPVSSRSTTDRDKTMGLSPADTRRHLAN
ncbi:hypothetical protein CRG98_047127, partial [Punica granatum]